MGNSQYSKLQGSVKVIVQKSEDDGQRELQAAMCCQTFEKGNFQYCAIEGLTVLGESYSQTALRIMQEQLGIKGELIGILRAEFENSKKLNRFRVIFLAKGKFDNKLQQTESEWIKYLEQGGMVYPLCILAREGSQPTLFKN